MPAAPADDAPVAAAEHDVDAAPSEPAALVEAVFGAARRVDPPARRRGSAPCGGERPSGKLEQDALAERALAEPAHLGGHAQRELCLSHRAGHDRGHRGRAADLGLEHAAVERVEPRRAEPPAGESSASAQAGSRARG